MLPRPPACQKDFLTSWWRGSKLSTIRNGRLAAPDGLQYFLAHWAYYGLFRAPRAAFVRPYQFPLKSCGFPGAETARKRFLLWKMGFSAAAYCEPMHPSIQHGRTTALAGSLAALPASLGLLRAVSPTGRALRAPPPYTPPGTIVPRKGFSPLALSPKCFNSLTRARRPAFHCRRICL